VGNINQCGPGADRHPPVPQAAAALRHPRSQLLWPPRAAAPVHVSLLATHGQCDGHVGLPGQGAHHSLQQGKQMNNGAPAARNSQAAAVQRRRQCCRTAACPAAGRDALHSRR
jgi:hypothetical protein